MGDQGVVSQGTSEERWSGRWLAMLRKIAPGTRLEQGRAHVRRGRVRDLDVQLGRVTAQVHDRELGRCDVVVAISTLDDREWGRVMAALGSQALFAAQLLAGDMPADIEQIFQRAGVSLLPTGAHELESRCSRCAAWQQPCQHAAAVYYLLGEMLDDDPWLIFRLRGRERQQILQALRQQRSERDVGGEATSTPGMALREPGSLYGVTDFIRADAQLDIQPDRAPLDEAPLSEQLDTFWGNAKQIEALHHRIAPPSIELALLRRLGPPPFAAGSLETYQRLRDIYRQVSQQALALAYATNSEDV